jgi:hypothetical protein
MEVRTGELPPNWQGVNLCRLSTSLMDKLQILPGDLILIESDFNQNKSFARVGVRCVDYYDNNTPIELDPDLLRYLEIKIGDSVIVSAGLSPEPLVSLSLEAIKYRESNEDGGDSLKPVDLMDSEKEKYIEVIQKARWPVYQGGMFSVNLTGETVLLYINADSNPNAVNCVVAQNTLIEIYGAKEQKIFQTTNQIRIANATLLELDNDIKVREMTLKDYERELERVESQYGLIDSQEQKLQDKKELLEDELSSIPGQLAEQETQFENLLREIQKLEEQYNEIEEHVDSAGYNIQQAEKQRNLVKDKLSELIKNLEANQ